MSTHLYPTSFTASLFASYEYQDMHRHLLAEALHIPASYVWKTGSYLDKKGIDYVARLDADTRVTFDIKERGRGAQRFWKAPNNPDIAIELQSIAESGTPGPLFRDSPYPDV